MFQTFFLDHPRRVGETYWGHAHTAGSFGVRMVIGGVACMIHGLLPAFFVKTGSTTVRNLYGEMQPRSERASRAEMPPLQFLPEYEI
ncbi:MAG: DUF6356 family protein [Pseudomonadota bacterium]|uniref:DUF6356 family protein n=1 Tax=unclassified Sphingobium TaxID=2611147 RepID=UPI001E5CC293|nr:MULTISPECIES: DUF6356 family protein [unclassified Sphingobium]GLI98272.1 type 1 capsular polysaccharide biosynthesis protein J [Sphingobium sp. BS19]CAH0350479.1 hypothetical protein SPH9361_01170 [Sphingobium sp. CECT 9361]|tara:strand:- start:98 stop:358 length:261 start_codon:yes stop_codon:yes gene_type:complete